jgi:hypothetical protein
MRILSIFLGLLVGYILAVYFTTPEQHGPDSNVVRRDIHRDQRGGCYQFEPVAHVCGVRT